MKPYLTCGDCITLKIGCGEADPTPVQHRLTELLEQAQQSNRIASFTIQRSGSSIIVQVSLGVGQDGISKLLNLPDGFMVELQAASDRAELRAQQAAAQATTP